MEEAGEQFINRYCNRMTDNKISKTLETKDAETFKVNTIHLNDRNTRLWNNEPKKRGKRKEQGESTNKRRTKQSRI